MAAGATPTKNDPKRLFAPSLLTVAVATLYTAAAAERGTRLTDLSLVNTGLRDFDKVWFYDGAAYNDETADAASATTADVTILVDSADYFYLGSASKFSHVTTILSTLGAGLTCTWQYWNGAAWIALAVTGSPTAVADFEASGEVSFTPPTDWATTAVNGSTQYWVRASTSAVTTAPVGTQVRAGTQGAPTVDIYLVPSGGSAIAVNKLAAAAAIPCDGAPFAIADIRGCIMNASDTLRASCSVENQVTMHGSGIEMAA